MACITLEPIMSLDDCNATFKDLTVSFDALVANTIAINNALCELDTRVGDNDDLLTDNSTTLVMAINEIYNQLVDLADSITDSVTIATMNVNQETVTITNPDGSEITFPYSNSVTTASIDTDAQTVTITNPDGNVIEFPYAFEVDYESPCEAPAVTELSDADMAIICRNNTMRQVPVGAFFQDICFNDVPDMGTVPSLGQQLTLWDDNGCMRLGRVVPDSSSSSTSTLADIWTHVPENTSGYTIPADLPTPNLFYTVSQISNDGGVDTQRYEYPNGTVTAGNRRTAPFVDEDIISNCVVGRWSSTSLFTRTIRIITQVNRPSPATFEEAMNRRGTFGVRNRQRIGDMTDWGPWLYGFAPGTGRLAFTGTENSLTTNATYEMNIPVLGGDFEIEVFYLSGSELNPYIINVNTHRPGYGATAPSVLFNLVVT